jgi:hypothetical protein
MPGHKTLLSVVVGSSNKENADRNNRNVAVKENKPEKETKNLRLQETRMYPGSYP